MPRANAPKTLAALLTAIVSVGALSSCSSGASPADIHAKATPFSEGVSSPTTAPVNTAAVTSPSPGAILSSDQVFNYVVPGGWNITNNPKAILDLSSATVAHSVAPTIVVTQSQQTPAPALSDVLQMSLMQARQEGASVQHLPDRTIGGESAVGFTSDSVINSIETTQTYYLVAHNKKLYIIVSTAPERDATSVKNTLDSLLATWSWTKAGDKNSTGTGTAPAAIPTTTSTSSTAKPSTSSSSTSTSSTSPGASSATSVPKPASTSSVKH